jgi:hypothetical protein
VHLKDAGGEPYRYDVAVLTDGDALVVAEAYFPTADDESRFGGKVLAALAGFGGAK